MNTATNDFPQSSKSGFQNAVARIRELPPKQLIGLALVLLMLPMVVTATLHQVLIGSRAWFGPYPISSPGSVDPQPASPKPTPISPPVNTSPPINTGGDPGNRRPADFTGDGNIDLVDYHQLVLRFGTSPENKIDPADLNEDGQVDIEDFNIFIESF